MFSCFRNPPNSDMDYRIFKVRMWSLLCVRTHTGFGHTDNESAHNFNSEKLSHIFLVLRIGFEPLVFAFGRVDALPIEPPSHPSHDQIFNELSTCSCPYDRMIWLHAGPSHWNLEQKQFLRNWQEAISHHAGSLWHVLLLWKQKQK